MEEEGMSVKRCFDVLDRFILDSIDIADKNISRISADSHDNSEIIKAGGVSYDEMKEAVRMVELSVDILTTIELARGTLVAIRKKYGLG